MPTLRQGSYFRSFLYSRGHSAQMFVAVPSGVCLRGFPHRVDRLLEPHGRASTAASRHRGRSGASSGAGSSSSLSVRSSRSQAPTQTGARSRATRAGAVAGPQQRPEVLGPNNEGCPETAARSETRRSPSAALSTLSDLATFPASPHVAWLRGALAPRNHCQVD